MGLTAQNSVTSYLFDRKHLGLFLLSSFSFLLISSIFIWLGLLQSLGLAVLGIILGTAYIFLCIKYPKFWLYSITASTYFFFQMGKADISAFEIIQGGFFSGSAFLWIFWQIFVKKEKIVRNLADWSILFFFFALIINMGISYLNGNDLLNWTREYLLASAILLYFPYRHYLTTKKDVINLFLVFAFSMIFSDIQQLILYRRNAIEEAVYAFQLGSSVRFKQSIFSMSIVFGFLLSTYPKNFWKKLLIIGFTALTAMALIVTFSRTFWAMVAFAIILSFFYLPKRERISSILTTGIILLAFAMSIFIIFRENSSIVLTVIENRFLSATAGVKDKSVETRLQEYVPVIKSIKENPLGGRGLGTSNTYREALDMVTIRTLNVHNGYLYFAYRTGIPLFLFFLFPILYYLFKGERLARQTDDIFLKLILLGSFSSLIIMVVANFLANVFTSRDGEFLLIFSFFLIGFAENRISDNKKNLEQIQSTL